MYRVTRTIYNVILETAKMLGTPYTPLRGSTLNEKYNIVAPSSDTILPELKYYGIGLHYGDLIENNAFTLEEVKHNPNDGDMFRPVPFITRKKNVGLTALERQSYRLIVEKTIDGEIYLLCYLKFIDSIDSNSRAYKITKDTEYTIDNLEDLNLEVLNPVPKKGLELYPTELTYLGHSQKLRIELSFSEATEIKNSIDILYPGVNPGNLYEIGEIALVSGIESVYNGKTEIANAQVGFFKKTSLLLNSLTLEESASEVFEIGGMLPMPLRN